MTGRIGAALLLFVGSSAFAERLPVLPQVEVPHDYYFREMYLPRLTVGPSGVAWLDDDTLVYSMGGSLWRQRIGSDSAAQLTSGAGYDYQPDVAPDGSRIVFARYDGQAIELWQLDTASGRTAALTSGGAVNVEPRYSPDGRRLAFVSTAGTGRFHVFVGEFTPTGLASRALLPERRSEVSRYYYSEYDHELSPAWSPDGRGLVLVANPDTPYGTGAIWLYRLDATAEPTLVRQEETTWKARPDVAPDGRRVAYASYLGRQWHQLWVTTIGSNAEPFPLTYGDFDVTAPRWSPDGSRIAYVSNETGNLRIVVQDAVGGRTEMLEIASREYRDPVGRLALDIVDEAGQAVPARVSVLAADGRAYAPEGAWMQADDGFDRAVRATEPHYFHLGGPATLTLPAGPAGVTVWRGPEYGIEERRITVEAGTETPLTVTLRPLPLPDAWRNHVGADVHVHMNYGGTYRNTPARLARQAAAEDLDVVFNLVVNKEQRIPDIDHYSPAPDPASTPATLILHSQEFHTSYWGHLALLGLDDHLLLPGYAAYPGTAAASLFPDNATVAELAREQGALVGYVHPFLAPAPDPATDPALTHALPVDAALGLVDFYEVIGFADHRASAEVWYRLMNCGIRIPAAGGTDAMANYASLRGPVGLNRTYVRVDAAGGTGNDRRDNWLAGLAAGRSLATNGPLIGFEVEGRGPGDELALAGGEQTLRYRGFLRSAVPVDHLELVFNGRVIRTLRTEESGRSADFEGSVTVDGSGWLLARAWSDGSHPLLFDLYAYATTTPVWISVDGRRPASTEDADYFLSWIARLRENAAGHPDYRSAAERAAVLGRLDGAAERYLECRR